MEDRRNSDSQYEVFQKETAQKLIEKVRSQQKYNDYMEAQVKQTAV